MVLHELDLIKTLLWSSLNVCEYWNALEGVLIRSIDSVAPLKAFKVNLKPKSNDLPKPVKQKINKRKRLLKLDIKNNCTLHYPEIKILNKEINIYFLSRKLNNVKRAALGPRVNIWKAVKIAKNLCPTDIPQNMLLGGVPVRPGGIADSFASYFHEKVKINSKKAKVVNSVYNGTCKLIVQNRNYMKTNDVKMCLDDLTTKKCEGFDRIPNCVLYDCRVTLLTPLAGLFDKIYKTGVIPDQWKVSKVVPIFKKGNKDEIENYRPIANLCSTSKILEKLILKQIHYLESTNKLDLTGKNQHGFKKNKSTATAGALLQSMIARAADNKCFVVMASLDLSMAFDLVNTELLVKRLKVMGLPMDVINLIREWLIGRSYYVQIGEECSFLFDSVTGTIQGSVLGPILYALFVSPLFDLTDVVNFADDNFCVEWNMDLSVLIINLEKRLEMITKWLKESGMLVNESKTELCLFHINDQPLIRIKLQNDFITSKKSMNVLGVIFDSKLNWQIHTNHAISKAKKALFALRLLRKYFSINEMRSLLDSNFYSILYYNSVIWLTPSLSCDSKQNLLSISANALRTCLKHEGYDVSFDNIHKNNKKCTPKQIMFYTQAINLHKILNHIDFPESIDHVSLIDQTICTSRQLSFQIFKNNKTKIGMNTLANKLHFISGTVSFSMLNMGFVHFKKLAKIQFLKFGRT